MGVKNVPSLYSLSLLQVVKMLLFRWKETYNNDFGQYSEEIKQSVGQIFPYTIYDQIFESVVISYARQIQIQSGTVLDSDNIPSVAGLIDSLISPCLRKVNLNQLRFTGRVKDEEIIYLEYILLRELPKLSNLVELSLQTSGTDFTLPTCNDEMLDKIGNHCPNLKTLDVSYNHTVTDEGLEYLVPSQSRLGCPRLTKITLFECSVSSEGVSSLLDGLPQLKFLGYRESGLALLHFDKKKSSPEKLELAHVNNLGTLNRTCKDLFKLTCDEKMVNVIVNKCPKLNGLKVRVNDSDVKHLQAIKSVCILELVFNLGSPMSPGHNTIQYLHLNGTQLVSLSFVCDVSTTSLLKVVCEQCINLKRLWIRSNKFICDQDISLSDKRKCALNTLEVFFLRVGCPESQICSVPYSVISYILHKSNTLFELSLAMKNPLMSDSYVQQLFSSIQTSTIKNIMLLIPFKNVSLSSLNLSMATVETLISMCPQLEQLGNILVWDVCLEEIQELRRQLKMCNSDLVLIYRMMYS